MYTCSRLDHLEIVAPVAGGNGGFLSLHPIDHVQEIDVRVLVSDCAVTTRTLHTVVLLWRCGRCEGVKVWRCEGMEVWRCEGMEVWRCEGVPYSVNLKHMGQ